MVVSYGSKVYFSVNKGDGISAPAPHFRWESKGSDAKIAVPNDANSRNEIFLVESENEERLNLISKGV